jgi:aminodeoxyfutalosine synthase
MTAMDLLQSIAEKVNAGQRLTFDEGVALEREADLFMLGELANLVRERKHRKRT